MSKVRNEQDAELYKSEAQEPMSALIHFLAAASLSMIV